MKEKVERKDEGPRVTNSRKRGRVALHGSEPMQTGLASKRMRLAAGHTESEGIAAACKFLDETASSDNSGHQRIDGLSAWSDKAAQCRPLFLLDLFVARQELQQLSDRWEVMHWAWTTWCTSEALQASRGHAAGPNDGQTACQTCEESPS